MEIGWHPGDFEGGDDAYPGGRRKRKKRRLKMKVVKPKPKPKPKPAKPRSKPQPRPRSVKATDKPTNQAPPTDRGGGDEEGAPGTDVAPAGTGWVSPTIGASSEGSEPKDGTGQHPPIDDEGADIVLKQQDQARDRGRDRGRRVGTYTRDSWDGDKDRQPTLTWIDSQGNLHRLYTEIDEDQDEWGQPIAQFWDEGVPGDAPLVEHVGLLAAIHGIEDGEIDTLIVPSLDRLARDQWILEQALNRIWRAGGEVYTENPRGRVGDDPESRAIRRRYLHNYEAQLVAIRECREFRWRALVERQGYGGGPRFGDRPYGREWVIVDGIRRYRVVPAEQRWIRWMCERNKIDGWSTGKIAKALNEQGVPTVMGRPWQRQTVLQIIRRGPVRSVGVISGVGGKYAQRPARARRTA
jgi:DNA invertase Pin-like site-specific DNA recombinase